MVGSTVEIPLILLKTRSQPHDAYEEYFSTSFSLDNNNDDVDDIGVDLKPKTSTQTPQDTSASTGPAGEYHQDDNDKVAFQPVFVPVLEHTRNEKVLAEVGNLLKSGKLKERFGGIIFTSQRAVEAFADTAGNVERELRDHHQSVHGTQSDSDLRSLPTPPLDTTAVDTRTSHTFSTDILTSSPFPLYSVGPATSRLLSTLLASSPTLRSLSPVISGTETGNGANLAQHILSHYNRLQDEKYFTWFEAPRLPFIPLLGMGSENYSRKRLEGTDERLAKKPLLFLVGETRDIIPKTLMNKTLPGWKQIRVDEWEVYGTTVMDGFSESFGDAVEKLEERSEMEKKSNIESEESREEQGATTIRNRIRRRLVVIVVFSPQGSAEMLQKLGFITKEQEGEEDDGEKRGVDRRSSGRWHLTEKGRERSNNQTYYSDLDDDDDDGGNDESKYVVFVVVSIGPTTRDHLRDNFGFRVDVCAEKPSPEGVRKGLINLFLKERK